MKDLPSTGKKSSSRKAIYLQPIATEDEWAYLNSCARIRNISVTSMVRLMVQTIMKDQMVEAILDDASTYYAHRYKGELPFRGLK